MVMFKNISWKESALVISNIAVMISMLSLTSFLAPNVWYENLIEDSKPKGGAPHVSNNVTVFIVDAEIPENYNQLNIVESIDFTGEGFLGEECGNSHGVMVANIIGGETVGVNPGVPVVGIKVLPCEPDTKTLGNPLRTGLKWVEENSIKGDIVNISLTDLIEGSPRVEDIISELVEKGVIVVSAAGNTTSDEACQRVYGATVHGTKVVSGIKQGSIIDKHVKIVEEFVNSACVNEYMPAINVLTLNMFEEPVKVDGTSFAAAFKTGLISLE